MTDTAQVAITVSLISTLGVVLSAIVAWMMNVTVRDRASQQEDKLASLQSELRGTEERLRSALDRELLTHESRLRIQGELSLRLFSDAAVSAQEATRALVSVFEALASANPTGRNPHPIVTLLSSGLFLPPELDEPYAQILKTVIIALDRLQKAESKDDRSSATADFASQFRSFRELATEWKRRHWEQIAASAGDREQL